MTKKIEKFNDKYAALAAASKLAGFEPKKNLPNIKKISKEAKKKAIDKELDDLIATYSPHELEVRFFKNFGCINFKTDEDMYELKLARAYHDFHKKWQPELHDEHEYEKWRCYHVTTCKCGFEEACDSSD